MRQHLIALAACASVAHADPPKHDKVDVSAAIGQVDVLRDETGRYYVMPKGNRPDNSAALEWTFYGDRRTMYRQRVVAYSSENGNVTIGAWSPRARGLPAALLEKKKDGTTSLICRMQASKYVRRPLTLVSEAEAKKLFETARFEPEYWERRVFFFGRGEGSKYYLVDILRDEYGGAGLRLFVGQKGQMKQVPISDFANDTGGAAVTTKIGELRIDTSDNAVWKQGKKMVALTRLDAGPNAFLIYRELGVYGQLGTICEDQ